MDSRPKGVKKISKSSLSVFVFGLYLAVLGIILLVAPNFLLGMFFMPDTTEVWIRVVGVLVFYMSFYYIQTARNLFAVMDLLGAIWTGLELRSPKTM